MSNKFYQKFLMDHFKKPRNKEVIENPDFASGQKNPSCGDSVSITGLLDNGKIKKVCFYGSGCVISQATASILTQKCEGKTVEEVLALTKDDILKMIGLELGPNRLKCALISLEALQKSLLDLEK